MNSKFIQTVTYTSFMSRTDGASWSHFLRALPTDTILEMVFWPRRSKYQSSSSTVNLNITWIELYSSCANGNICLSQRHKVCIFILWITMRLTIYVVDCCLTHQLTFSSDAVYDGHGGAKIASHVSKHLHKTLVRRPEYKQGNYEEAFVKVGFLFNLCTTQP